MEDLIDLIAVLSLSLALLLARMEDTHTQLQHTTTSQHQPRTALLAKTGRYLSLRMGLSTTLQVSASLALAADACCPPKRAERISR